MRGRLTTGPRGGDFGCCRWWRGRGRSEAVAAALSCLQLPKIVTYAMSVPLCNQRLRRWHASCIMVGMTLTQIQERALLAMLEPRSSERRAEKMRGAVLRQYRKSARRLGYTQEQVEMQVCDLRDMYRLRVDATEEHRGWL